MALDSEPVGIIERASSDGSEPRSHFGRMTHRCSTTRTELHLQPTTAFIGPMLALCERSLSEFHILLIEIRDDGECATEPALAEPAVTNKTHHRLRTHAIANGTAHAPAFMHVTH